MAPLDGSVPGPGDLSADGPLLRLLRVSVAHPALPAVADLYELHAVLDGGRAESGLRLRQELCRLHRLRRRPMSKPLSHTQRDGRRLQRRDGRRRSRARDRRAPAARVLCAPIQALSRSLNATVRLTVSFVKLQ